ncbi:MAG TPA: thioesterase domain-containing protein, partial [Thermoanaerobaculia bacterium]|nr:thioesterase domain-containing protein [Thermoanaerobaculia bacterium]
QPHGSRPPLFCVHPSGGGVLCYVDLAYHLGADQPLYGLEAPGWSDGGEPLDSVGEMASRYLAAVRRMRPQGPYCLAGWSFGGLVAHEMARHLCLQGEEVATLALFDTATGGPDPGGEPDDAQLLSNLIEDAVPISVEELRRLGGLDEQLRHVIDLAQRERLLPDDFDAGRVRRLVEVDRGTHRAASRFTPQPYPGPLTLFRAAEAVGRLRELVLRDPVMGWGSLAGRVEVQVVPGRHDLLVRRPWVEVLAARLGELLAASC